MLVIGSIKNFNIIKKNNKKVNDVLCQITADCFTHVKKLYKFKYQLLQTVLPVVFVISCVWTHFHIIHLYPKSYQEPSSPFYVKEEHQ